MDENRLFHPQLHQSRPLGREWSGAARRFSPYVPSSCWTRREPISARRTCIDRRNSRCPKRRGYFSKRLFPYQSSRKMFADVIGQHAHYTSTYALSNNWLIKRLNRRALRKMQKNPKLMKKALEITAGVFTKKPGLIEQARMGGILP